MLKGLGILLRLGILRIVSVQDHPAVMRMAIQTDNWVWPTADHSNFSRTVLVNRTELTQEE